MTGPLHTVESSDHLADRDTQPGREDGSVGHTVPVRTPRQKLPEPPLQALRVRPRHRSSL